MPLPDDEDFPDRPQHPDFAVLSETVLQHDGKAEDLDFRMLDYIATVVDPDSLRYFIEHRVGRFIETGAPMIGLIGGQPAAEALWLDAFLMGVAYAERKKT